MGPAPATEGRREEARLAPSTAENQPVKVHTAEARPGCTHRWDIAHNPPTELDKLIWIYDVRYNDSMKKDRMRRSERTDKTWHITPQD